MRKLEKKMSQCNNTKTYRFILKRICYFRTYRALQKCNMLNSLLCLFVYRLFLKINSYD